MSSQALQEREQEDGKEREDEEEEKFPMTPRTKRTKRVILIRRYLSGYHQPKEKEEDVSIAWFKETTLQDVKKRIADRLWSRGTKVDPEAIGLVMCDWPEPPGGMQSPETSGPDALVSPWFLSGAPVYYDLQSKCGACPRFLKASHIWGLPCGHRFCTTCMLRDQGLGNEIVFKTCPVCAEAVLATHMGLARIESVRKGCEACDLDAPGLNFGTCYNCARRLSYRNVKRIRALSYKVVPKGVLFRQVENDGNRPWTCDDCARSIDIYAFTPFSLVQHERECFHVLERASITWPCLQEHVKARLRPFGLSHTLVLLHCPEMNISLL